MLLIGDDWAEAHHDIEIEDGSGRVLATEAAAIGAKSDPGDAHLVGILHGCLSSQTCYDEHRLAHRKVSPPTGLIAASTGTQSNSEQSRP